MPSLDVLNGLRKRSFNSLMIKTLTLLNGRARPYGLNYHFKLSRFVTKRARFALPFYSPVLGAVLGQTVLVRSTRLHVPFYYPVLGSNTAIGDEGEAEVDFVNPKFVNKTRCLVEGVKAGA